MKLFVVVLSLTSFLLLGVCSLFFNLYDPCGSYPEGKLHSPVIQNNSALVPNLNPYSRPTSSSAASSIQFRCNRCGTFISHSCGGDCGTIICQCGATFTQKAVAIGHGTAAKQSHWLAKGKNTTGKAQITIQDSLEFPFAFRTETTDSTCLIARDTY